MKGGMWNLLAVAVLLATVLGAAHAATWSEEQKLTSSDGTAQDFFGGNVALGSGTAIITAQLNDGVGFDAGAAYVFVQGGTTWSEAQKLTASDGAPDDYFGRSLAMDGDTVVIGSYRSNENPGAAYVFVQDGGTWTQQQKLVASDGTIWSEFTKSMGLHGDTLTVGAPGDNDNGDSSGAAYVFTRSGTTWTEQQKLTASDPTAYAHFGSSVALDGDTALIGAESASSPCPGGSGAVYVFTRSGGTWSEVQKLTDPGGSGPKAPCEQYFGSSVALDGDTAVIGARGYSYSTGAAYVFVHSGDTWSDQQTLTASDGAFGDLFGVSVALDGDRAIVGAADDDDNGTSSGAAYVFTRSGTTWSEEQKLTASDGASNNDFGSSVALNGDMAVIGAPGDINYDPGAAYTFVLSSGGGSDIALDGFQTGNGQELVKVDYTLTGMGGASFDLGFYRSADAAFDGSDEWLSTYTIADPADLTDGAHSLSLALGSDLDLVQDGNETGDDYYLLAVADPADTLAEDDKTNNEATFEGVYQYAGAKYAVFVHGTAGDDSIVVNPGGGVSLNGVTTPNSNVSGYRIRARDGADFVRLDDTPTTVEVFVLAGGGDDVLRPSPLLGALDGGSGSDTVNFVGLPHGVNANLATGFAGWGMGNCTLAGVENMIGTQLADQLHGDGNDNHIEGWGGADIIYGHGGNDQLLGGAGYDKIWGGSGSDVLRAQADGADMWGDAGNDRLQGGDGADWMDGGEGNDTFWPGLGDDVLYGQAGVDTVDYYHPIDLNGVTIDLKNRTASGHGSDTLYQIENALGTDYADWIQGDWQANFLSGRGGDDEIYGLSAADTLWGGPGADWLNGGVGDDAIYAYDDTCADEGVQDWLYGHQGSDDGYGVLAQDYFHHDVENVHACP